MLIVSLTSITVPEDRQRRHFSPAKLSELEESIRFHGLLHPLVVQPVENGQFVLRAGERRLRCITALAEKEQSFYCNAELIAPGFAAVTCTHELDPVALKELEFDENLKREDLTWQERDRALAEIMALRRKQNPEITRLAVAREISDATSEPVETIRRDLAQAELIAQHLDNPKVSNARSSREAYAIITSELQSEFKAALREKVGKTTDHEIYCDDLLRFLPTLQVSRYDCIIADPPYGMDADTFGTAGPSHEYADSRERGLEIASAIVREGFRLCKPEAHLYLFCDLALFPELCAIAARAGWTPFRTPLVWDKGGSAGHNPIPAQAIRRSYELILFAEKGGRPALHMISDVIRDIPNVRQSIHAAEKPGRLYEHLLARSCKPGDFVLDPCCGVGPVFAAANALRLRAVGIELDKGFATIASERRFGETTLEPREQTDAGDL